MLPRYVDAVLEGGLKPNAAARVMTIAHRNLRNQAQKLR
jgi:hypothetical protein